MLAERVAVAQKPVFDTMQFQDTTTVHLNDAARQEVLELLSEFEVRELGPAMLAFRKSLSCPRVPSKP